MYSYAGAVLRSAIPLELPVATEGVDGPLVELRRLPDRATARPRYATYAVRGWQTGRRVALGRVDDEWIAWLPPYLTARIAAGAIGIEAFPGVGDDKLNEHIVGNVLPFWLAVTGRWAFHGGAARHPELGSVAVLGPTHSGKSTTIAVLVADGWELIADDTTTGRIEDGRVLLDATSDTLHLRGQADRLTDLGDLVRSGTDPEGRVTVRARNADTPLPLDRLLFLGVGANPTHAAKRVPAALVVKYLLDNSRVAAWVDDGLRTVEFGAAAEVAGLVPGFEIAGPDAFVTPGEYAAYVLRIVASDAP